MTEGKREQRTGYLVEARGEVGDDGRMGEGGISTGDLSTYSLGLGTCPRAWSGCPPYLIQHMSIPVVWHFCRGFPAPRRSTLQGHQATNREEGQ